MKFPLSFQLGQLVVVVDRGPFYRLSWFIRGKNLGERWWGIGNVTIFWRIP